MIPRPQECCKVNGDKLNATEKQGFPAQGNMGGSLLFRVRAPGVHLLYLFSYLKQELLTRRGEPLGGKAERSRLGGQKIQTLSQLFGMNLWLS